MIRTTGSGAPTTDSQRQIPIPPPSEQAVIGIHAPSTAGHDEVRDPLTTFSAIIMTDTCTQTQPMMFGTPPGRASNRAQRLTPESRDITASNQAFDMRSHQSPITTNSENTSGPYGSDPRSNVGVHREPFAAASSIADQSDGSKDAMS